MKTLVRTVCIAFGVAAVAACGSGSKQSETPAGESPDATQAALPAPETPAQPDDEWVAKPDGGVDVNLPEAPVTTETTTPAPAPAKPEAQSDR